MCWSEAKPPPLLLTISEIHTDRWRNATYPCRFSLWLSQDPSTTYQQIEEADECSVNSCMQDMCSLAIVLKPINGRVRNFSRPECRYTSLCARVFFFSLVGIGSASIMPWYFAQPMLRTALRSYSTQYLYSSSSSTFQKDSICALCVFSLSSAPPRLVLFLGNGRRYRDGTTCGKFSFLLTSQSVLW